MSGLTTIGGYYQLPANTASGSNTPVQAVSTTASPPPPNNASSLDNSAYLLDLSPEAQNYLSTINAPGNSASSDSFALNARQQQQFNDILVKYKDAPFNQATFDNIQDDLNKAGLGVRQLSQLDQIQNDNPTQWLLNDLNGNYTDITLPQANNTQTKADAYLQQIMSQWQQLSSAAATSAQAPGASAIPPGA